MRGVELRVWAEEGGAYDMEGGRLGSARRWLCGEGGAARRAGVEISTFESEGDEGVDAGGDGRRLRVWCGL